MPPARVCGQTFLFSVDDIALLGPASALLHVLWLVSETTFLERLGSWRMGVPTVFMTIDAGLLTAGILLDLWILAWASRGAILEPHHRRKSVGVVVARWALNVVIFAMIVTQTVLVVVNVFLIGRQRYKLVGHVGGWMPGLGANWLVIPPLAYLGTLVGKWAIYVMFFAMLWAAHVGTPDVDSAVTERVEHVLKFFGAHQKLTSEILKVIVAVQGQETFAYATPTDLFFGLVLHAARQQQLELGLAPPEPIAEEDAAAPEDAEAGAGFGSPQRADALRASLIAVAQPFDPKKAEDKLSLKDLTHYWPYAVGIYGCCANTCFSTVNEGTLIPNPLRLLRTLWAALPCRQRTPREVSKEAWRCCGVLPPKGNVKGDDWLGLSCMEYALRRTLDVAAVESGHHTPPKLVHATWDDLGPERSPPFAIFVDDKREEVVITIRGTLNMWDCLTDATAAPVVFDPANGVGLSRGDAVHWSGETQDPAKAGSFDSDAGLFVHSGVWKCALDAKERMAGSLSELKASGGVGDYQVVCVGHSLGAAVACVLALMLRKDGGFADARYVGFAPPGATMSKKLSEYTASLGWLSGVCSHDVISRLSVHALQELREEAFRELATCKRTKLQIAYLYLAGRWQRRPLCRPLAALFGMLGGGPLDLAGKPLPTHAEAVEAARGFLRQSEQGAPAAHAAVASKAAPSEDSDSVVEELKAGLHRRTLGVRFFPRLLVPGRVAYVRPTRVEPLLFGLALRDVRWTAGWVQPQDLEEIILTWRSVELHMPTIMGPAFRSALQELSGPTTAGAGGGYGTFGKA